MPSIKLNGLFLPARAEFRRDIVSPESRQVGDFADKYDFHTLFYDAFYVPERRAIALLCPPLLNLEKLLREAAWSAGGQRLRVAAIYNRKRHSEVWLRGADNPTALTFAYGDVRETIPLGRAQTDLFEDLRCVVTKSKNNDLRWIRDWAHYHVKVHGLEGVVLFDNNSDRYSVEDVEATLNAVSGLKRVSVISAPYTFGPYSDSNTWFLQVALLNIARLRLLSKAAGVLSIDIDELVSPSPEGSIFETARRSLLGYALIPGRWRYPEFRDGVTQYHHEDHIFQRKNEASPVWNKKMRQTKYCVCPKGPVGLVHWDIHGSVRGSLKPHLVTDKIGFWHCRAVSSSWMYKRDIPKPDELVIADETVAALERAFGAASDR